MIPTIQSTGQCAGLDAWTCADHDNCASVMSALGAADTAAFDHCIAEPGGVCNRDGDCGQGQRCDTSVCHAPDGSTCRDSCVTCYGVCVSAVPCSALTTEAACTARADCSATYTGYDCTCIGNTCTCKTEVFASCDPG
jgi:hypothetical protein